MLKIAVVAMLVTGVSTVASAEPSEDLTCFSASLDMMKYAGDEQGKQTFAEIGMFFLGRLTVIDPNSNWSKVALDQQHRTPKEAMPILYKCQTREFELVSPRPTEKPQNLDK